MQLLRAWRILIYLCFWQDLIVRVKRSDKIPEDNAEADVDAAGVDDDVDDNDDVVGDGGNVGVGVDVGSGGDDDDDEYEDIDDDDDDDDSDDVVQAIRVWLYYILTIVRWQHVLRVDTYFQQVI